VHPANTAGRYRIHFGAKRLRAARRAGLDMVPVVVRDAPGDPYAQVAENQKRHGLTPLQVGRQTGCVGRAFERLQAFRSGKLEELSHDAPGS